MTMDPPRVLELLQSYGQEAVSFQALTAGCAHWFTDDACVAYVDTGSAWVAAGSPIAEPARKLEVADRFLHAARAAGRRARFFATEQAHQDELLASLQVGQQPIWDPASWPEGLSRKLARQVRQHRARAWVRTRELGPALSTEPQGATREALESLMRRWLDARSMAPMSFLVRLAPYAMASERRYFVAEFERRCVGVIIAMPIYGERGWLLETCVRDPAAPSGTVELLFDHALRTFAEEGCRHVSFGMCPLTGCASPLYAAIRRSARALYDFEGLHRFKAKLGPARWSPLYLTHPRADSPTLALFDALAAFCPEGMLRFAAQTLWKHARTLGEPLSLPEPGLGITMRPTAG